MPARTCIQECGCGSGRLRTDAVDLSARRCGTNRPVCSICGKCRVGGTGLSVEPFHYVELSHVLRVFFFHVVKSFHDHHLTRADCAVVRASNLVEGAFALFRCYPRSGDRGVQVTWCLAERLRSRLW